MLKGWFGESVASMLFLVPAWLAITFFKKNFGVAPETFLVYYFIGVILGGMLGMAPIRQLPWHVGALTIGVGIVFGAPGNFRLYHAIPLAPSEALPIAISMASAACVYGASLLLGYLFPQYFAITTFNVKHLMGILLVICGVILLSQK